DIGVHLVADESLPAEGEPHVAADLADPNGLPAAPERRPPDAQVITLPSGLAGLLQRHVLAPPKQIDRAHRGVPVLIGEEVGPEGFQGRAWPQDLADVPTGADEAREGFVRLTDHDEVQRILGAATVFARRTARHV